MVWTCGQNLRFVCGSRLYQHTGWFVGGPNVAADYKCELHVEAWRLSQRGLLLLYFVESQSCLSPITSAPATKDSRKTAQPRRNSHHVRSQKMALVFVLGTNKIFSTSGNCPHSSKHNISNSGVRVCRRRGTVLPPKAGLMHQSNGGMPKDALTAQHGYSIYTYQPAGRVRYTFLSSNGRGGNCCRSPYVCGSSV